MTAYSSTPLLKKLGIKAGQSCYFHDYPESLKDSLGPFPEDTRWCSTLEVEHDYIHCFVTTKLELEDAVMALKPKLKKDGTLWISWLKGKHAVNQEINRDTIRSYVLTQGLVDVKVASIDHRWSGLKFVYRLKDR